MRPVKASIIPDMETGIDSYPLAAKLAESVAARVVAELTRKEAEAMKTWVYQDSKHKRKVGTARASWYVGWIDPAGKRCCQSCGAGAAGRKLARKEAERINAELVNKTYSTQKNATWAEFRAEYEAKVTAGMEPATRDATMYAMNHFEETVAPDRMRSIGPLTIAAYIAERRKASGVQPGSKLSPATINKELRTLRAALRKAERWGFIDRCPEIDFLRQQEKLPLYVPPEDFARLYAACELARWPEGLPYTPGAWWQSLLITAYMTGWRIGSLLALKRGDVNLDTGQTISRARDNKGRRDLIIFIPPLAIEHLKRIPAFSDCMFPWNHGRRRVFEEFKKMQLAAGIELAGEKKQYTFHDLRRGFATMNADRMSADMLQASMQHRDYGTTRGYINLARQLRPAALNVFTPDLPALRAAGR